MEPRASSGSFIAAAKRRAEGSQTARPERSGDSPGPSYLVGRTSPDPTNPCAAGPLRHHRGTGRCGR